MSIQARIVFGIVLFMLGVAIGWKWENNAMLALDDEKQKQIVEMQERLNQALASLDAATAKKLSDDAANANVNEKTVEEDRVKNPTGYSAIVPPSGLLAYRRAIAATAATR